MPAIPGSVSVAPNNDIMPVINTKLISKDIFAAIPKTL